MENSYSTIYHRKIVWFCYVNVSVNVNNLPKIDNNNNNNNIGTIQSVRVRGFVCEHFVAKYV